MFRQGKKKLICNFSNFIQINKLNKIFSLFFWLRAEPGVISKSTHVEAHCRVARLGPVSLFLFLFLLFEGYFSLNQTTGRFELAYRRTNNVCIQIYTSQPQTCCKLKEASQMKNQWNLQQICPPLLMCVTMFLYKCLFFQGLVQLSLVIMSYLSSSSLHLILTYSQQMVIVLEVQYPSFNFEKMKLKERGKHDVNQFAYYNNMCDSEFILYGTLKLIHVL